MTSKVTGVLVAVNILLVILTAWLLASMVLADKANPPQWSIWKWLAN